MNEFENQPAIKSGWLRVLLIIIPYLLTVAFIQFGVILIYDHFTGENHLIELNEKNLLEDYPFMIALQLSTLLAGLVIIFIFRIFIDRKSIVSLGFVFRSKDTLLGILLGGVIMLIGALSLSFTGLTEITSLGFLVETFFASLILCIIISLNEEIFVRGYLLNNLMDSLSGPLALVVTSILFAMMHLFNPNISWVGMINLFLAGILLGTNYLFTKNLWFPIGLHFSWNFFQGPVFGFEVSGMNMSAIIQQEEVESNYSLLTGGEFGFEGSLLATALSLIAIWLTYSYFSRQVAQISE